MITKQEMQGKWKEIKGGLREKFGQITDDEFEKVGGNYEQLVGMIERRSGEARRNIETYLDQLAQGGQNLASQAANMASNAANTVRDYANTAGGAVKETYDQVASNVKDGMGHAEDMVKRRPVESIAITLGAGIVVGAILGLLIGRSRS